MCAQSYPTFCDPVDCSLWNFLGNNPGVDCHFLLQGIFPTQDQTPVFCLCIARCILHQYMSIYTYGGGLVTQSCPTLCDPMDYRLPGSCVHGDSPGKNTGVSCHALIQRIFPNQGLNRGLLHCRGILFLPSEPPGNSVRFSYSVVFDSL